MRDKFGDALIIFEEEFRRQIRRMGWRIFTAGIPVLLLIATLVVPFVVDAVSTSVREASQISALVTLPSVIPVWFSSLLIASPYGGLARALTFFPLTSPTAVMMRLSGGSNHNTDIWLGFVTTSFSAIVLVCLSARIFRAGLLLYGQRMSVSAIWSAVRSGD